MNESILSDKRSASSQYSKFINHKSCSRASGKRQVSIRTMLRSTKAIQRMVESVERVFADISATTDRTNIRSADSRGPQAPTERPSQEHQRADRLSLSSTPVPLEHRALLLLLQNLLKGASPAEFQRLPGTDSDRFPIPGCELAEHRNHWIA